MTLGVLKYSLCMTLLRFTNSRTMRLLVYTMIIINSTMALICLVVLSTMCRPYSASWRYYYDYPGYPKTGSCFNGSIILNLVFVLTGIIFVSDLACVVIPAILFWNTRMQRQQKVMAWALLSLGLLASVASLCRLPFNRAWIAKHNRPCMSIAHSN